MEMLGISKYVRSCVYLPDIWDFLVMPLMMNMFLILYKRSPTDLQKNEMMEVVRGYSGYREAVHIKIKYDDHASMLRSVISFDDLYIL